MSAPRTNIEKQKRDHRWPLIGMLLVVILVVLGFLWWLGDETSNPEMPGQNSQQTQQGPAAN